MVIDWNQYIQNCIKKKKILPSFHATSVEKHIQQIYVVQRLLDTGNTVDQIHSWFKVALEEEYDKDLVDRLIFSTKFIHRPKKRAYFAYITPEELNYINALEYSSEFKKYLLAMVCFCKFMKIKKKKPILTNRDKSYIYYLSTGHDDYNIGKQRHKAIEKETIRCVKDGVITFRVESKSFPGVKMGPVVKTYIILNAEWIDWDATKGYQIKDIEKDVLKLCKNIKKDVYACPLCGKKFNRSNKAKTDLCSECYKKRRKKAICENSKKYYLKKNID